MKKTDSANTATADVVALIALQRDKLEQELAELLARFENENGVTIDSVMVYHMDRQNDRPLLTSVRLYVMVPDSSQPEDL